MNEVLRPEPRQGVMDIAAYVPGKSAAPAGVAKVHKLSSNENPFGASPAAIEAMSVASIQETFSDGTRERGRTRRRPRSQAS